MNEMKKILLIGLVLLTTGCHTLTGALIGGGLGGIIGGRGGAAIGTAIGAGVGNELDMAEARANFEARTKSRETKVIDLGNGKKAIIVHGRLAGSTPSRENVRESNCEDFCERIGAVGKEKSECIRGCGQTEREIQRERERYWYERGRSGW